MGSKYVPRNTHLFLNKRRHRSEMQESWHNMQMRPATAAEIAEDAAVHDRMVRNA